MAPAENVRCEVTSGSHPGEADGRSDTVRNDLEPRGGALVPGDGGADGPCGHRVAGGERVAAAEERPVANAVIGAFAAEGVFQCVVHGSRSG